MKDRDIFEGTDKSHNGDFNKDLENILAFLPRLNQVWGMQKTLLQLWLAREDTFKQKPAYEAGQCGKDCRDARDIQKNKNTGIVCWDFLEEVASQLRLENRQRVVWWEGTPSQVTHKIKGLAVGRGRACRNMEGGRKEYGKNRVAGMRQA